jgi:trigger factor
LRQIKAVQIKELPALDDEFAKDISDFDTLEALKADKKAKMLEKREKNRKTAIEKSQLKIASDNAIVEIPDVMVERQIKYMLRDIAYQLSMSGLSLDDYCNNRHRPQRPEGKLSRRALARVKMQLVIEAIGERKASPARKRTRKPPSRNTPKTAAKRRKNSKRRSPRTIWNISKTT